MTSTPEPGLVGRAALLALSLVLAAAGAAAQPPSRGWAKDIAKAEQGLARGDGIAAEVALRAAQSAGAPRMEVAALMGEALLDQGAREPARGWLEPGQFAPSSTARGFRQLARLKRLDGDLPAAGIALDRAIALTPRDAGLWVEVAGLRYAGGEQLQAIDAAEYAVRLDPRHAGALVFNGMLVRDRQGLAAGLPWFKAALDVDPHNLPALGEYAATLGDMGRASDMLAATRQMLAIDPGNPRAFLLQAIMAARAGNVGLARKLLDRTGGRLDATPAARLLQGTLELEAGNPVTAVEIFSQLAARQPANRRVQALLARSLYANGNHRALIERFANEASRADASPYVLLLLARSHEFLGDRAGAAPLLDRVAHDYARPLAPVGLGSESGSLIAAGAAGEAQARSSRLLAERPGSAEYNAQAGDIALSRGDPALAVDRYRQAAKVRLSESLLLRLSVALEESGRGGEAASLVETYLAGTPSSRVARRLAAAIARQRGDFARAALLLDSLRADGARDARLLVDLAFARERAGDHAGASDAGAQAYRLHRASGCATQALAAASGPSRVDSASLIAKARALGAQCANLPVVRYPFGGSG